MSGRALVVAGTDTGVGKTIFSAALAGACGASYWKPIQSGLDGETDSQTAARLGALPANRIVPEAYRLRTPASPHRSAEIDGVAIDTALVPPHLDGALVIEGTGGLLVPVDRHTLMIDVFARWGLPIVLCARTALGGINHALLSIEALRRRDVPVLGIAFVGHNIPDTEATIAGFSGAPVLGRLPNLDPLTPATLRAAFATQFRLADFFP